MGLTHRDTYLHAGPQFHLADGSMTYAVSWVGGAHVFIPVFEPTATVSALADEHCTISLPPTMLGMVLASGALDGADHGTAGADVRRIAHAWRSSTTCR